MNERRDMRRSKMMERRDMRKREKKEDGAKEEKSYEKK